MPAPNFDLYLVTDRQQTGGRDLLSVLNKALDGGVRAVQLREKDLCGRDLFLLAEAARKLTQRYAARLLINDRIDIALAVDADGVQIGNASMPIDAARHLLGPEKMIGVSVHGPDEAQAAQAAGADFIVYGPIYYTPSKASYGAPQGVERLQQILGLVSLPVYAIGGIKFANLPALKETEVTGIALISAILSAGDPEAEARKLLALLRS